VDALAAARELEARDGALAAEAARLRELAEEAASIGAKAGEIETFFFMYAAEEARRREATEAAREDLARRRGEAAAAADEVERARSDDERAAAQAALRRAADHVAVAEARLARARAAEAELEADAAARQAEVPRLEERAQRAARELPELPPAPAGPRELVEWASRARATLFVALSGLDAQRERVIREANELGTVHLGEPTYGSTPAQVRSRIEATIAR
jgi:chromosome segregation ATPase